MSRTSDIELIRMAASHLRAECPPLFPVRIYFRTANRMPAAFGNNNYGLCVVNTDGGCVTGASIFIRMGSYGEMIDTLSHEWAHTLSWSMSEDEDHGPSWGLALSKVTMVLESI